jgi:hypothetical protein
MAEARRCRTICELDDLLKIHWGAELKFPTQVYFQVAPKPHGSNLGTWHASTLSSASGHTGWAH